MTSYGTQTAPLAVTNHPSLTHFTFKLIPQCRCSSSLFLFPHQFSIVCVWCVCLVLFFSCISRGGCWCWCRWRRRRRRWGGIWGIWVTQPSVKFICLWRWNNGPRDSRLSVIKEGEKNLAPGTIAYYAVPLVLSP